MVPRNSTPGGFAHIWQSKWVGIIAIKTEKREIQLFFNGLNAWLSLSLQGSEIYEDFKRELGLDRGYFDRIYGTFPYWFPSISIIRQEKKF